MVWVLDRQQKKHLFIIFRDPLLDVVSSDTDLDLMGIIIVGTPDDNEDKMLVGTRTAVWAEAMRADGVIIPLMAGETAMLILQIHVSSWGPRDCSDRTEFQRNGSTVVVTNDYLDGIVDINKSADGLRTNVVGENNVVELDCRKATALLKLKMRKMEEKR